jgi:hypothetical protein
MKDLQGHAKALTKLPHKGFIAVSLGPSQAVVDVNRA